ncbi:MAG TPA: ferritin [Desulfurivibrio alkaliphilus]|uniref:Ferritin n=1 Tax=Desulfurivibrio alkaliphilus TaxID=427923 RepID=A0A7C2THR8_9BACT|nr:ferritin [Desulfurivibrio alkaliphilus]
MLSKKMEKALNEQINAEFYSSYLYLAMSAHFETGGLPGCARWMQAQAQEEWFHGMKIYGFVHERGGRVGLKAIAAPPADWASTVEVFEQVREHERKVTGLINSLLSLALKENDHATSIFLQWFVSEQVEEEASVDAVLSKLKLIGKENSSLFALDGELGQRVFTPPPAK